MVPVYETTHYNIYISLLPYSRLIHHSLLIIISYLARHFDKIMSSQPRLEMASFINIISDQIIERFIVIFREGWFATMLRLMIDELIICCISVMINECNRQ